MEGNNWRFVGGKTSGLYAIKRQIGKVVFAKLNHLNIEPDSCPHENLYNWHSRKTESFNYSMCF